MPDTAYGEIVNGGHAAPVGPVLVAAVVTTALSNILVVDPHLIAGSRTVRRALDQDTAAPIRGIAVAFSSAGRIASVYVHQMVSQSAGLVGDK